VVTVLAILALSYLLSNGLSSKYKDLYLEEKELRLEERDKYELEIMELSLNNRDQQ